MEYVEHVRAFNRRWTEVLGLLDAGLLETGHSLTEARVLFELGRREGWDRAALRDRLGIDASFLTRVVARLEQAALVAAAPSPTDGRRITLSLTPVGRAAYELLDRRSRDQIAGSIAPLTDEARRTLAEAMTVVTSLLHPPPAAERAIALRPVGPGDLGWVVQRHGAIYAEEYGWDASFEALVATIVAEWQANRRSGGEDAWIAEVDGARAGCVFCCRRDADTAQLRILLVEPWARGLGLGARLVDTCVRFAREAGYPRIRLWTNDVLTSARRIYEAAGFALVAEEPHRSFGHDLIGQTWERALCDPTQPAAPGPVTPER